MSKSLIEDEDLSAEISMDLKRAVCRFFGFSGIGGG
jgi:hypothetical protein